MYIRRWPILAAAALVLIPPPAIEAQERSWRLNVVGNLGYMKPIRSLGNNATRVPDLPILQVITDFDPSPTVGGGLELDLLEHGITVRGIYDRTLSGASDSRLAFCGDPDDPFATGALCVPVETTGIVQSLAVDVYFSRGSPTARIKPILSIGGGLRHYQFEGITCNDPSDWQYICELAADVWADGGGITPFLIFGGGLRSQLGPVRALMEGQVRSGRYDGGINSATGNIQIDLALGLRLSVNVY